MKTEKKTLTKLETIKNFKQERLIPKFVHIIMQQKFRNTSAEHTLGSSTKAIFS